MSDHYNTLQDDYDNLEQYSRRNCLRIHGVPEIQGENTDNEAVNIFKNKLQVNIKSEHLDRSHRLGKYRLAGQANSRPRPIIVKFTRHIVL